MPFERNDVSSVHLPRLTRAEVNSLSDVEIVALFESAPLKYLDFDRSLPGDSQLVSLRICLLQNRDLFAKNDKKPGTVNSFGVDVR